MPRARHELHRGGEAIHVAAWPHGSELHQLASRHYAFEGACFVLLTALVTRPADLPDLGGDLPVPAEFTGLHGGSAIVGPDGGYLVGPQRGGEDLLVADLDLAAAERAAFYLDTAGHYDRPDLFD